jgi:hypothetical protein
LAVAAIKQLHPDTVHAVEAKALFSQDEEDLLASINSVGHDLDDTTHENLFNIIY